MRGRALSDAEASETRAKLVQVATRVLEREGRDACSLRRIGAEAGISRTTPYTYFASKEAMIDAVRVAALGALCEACEEAQRGASSVAEQLSAVGRAYVRFALDRPRLYDVVFEQHAPSAEHEAMAARYRALAEAPLRAAFEQGVTRVPPDRLAHVLWASTHGLIALHRAGKLRHGLSFDVVLKDLGDTLAFGFVVRGESEAP